MYVSALHAHLPQVFNLLYVQLYVYFVYSCEESPAADMHKYSILANSYLHTVRDTENLPFSADTPHRFSEGSRAAICGSPCGNARIASAAFCLYI